ncbi:protocatechuate 3,4-dioxygenase subunit alpha [Verticiella sediminum]|uniref:Protocatechuate 3,4-dioxygenase subunit alpha n=1 Tax=Verticiella sediminum TaxID=1247510 RepID=A0A556A7Y2_9BURK|nr:protocatechuate 3,4-dioxygenase subunit alpha [Verticiella sediminum]TSH88999.1 protocatechuate 3,4-dioxygenase subunit alpha [Verticiella sediminum]
MKLGQTPSQTVGPYFAYGLTPEQYLYDFRSAFTPVLVRDDTPGTPIEITGQVIDGAGKPINDAMLEIAHADASGRFVSSLQEVEASGFTGFGRCGTGTDAQNRYRFRTIKPAACGEGEAPYVNVIVTMRGMLVHAFTRMYFEDEAQANAQDPVLQSVPGERRETLIARREAREGRIVYRFDIHMQGERETVFFDL